MFDLQLEYRLDQSINANWIKLVNLIQFPNPQLVKSILQLQIENRK